MERYPYLFYLFDYLYSIEDKETKQVIKGVNFEARTIDENGEAYTCKVKPRQASDKAIIEMLLARL